jgi:glycerophosphoryl diester phosphodiesterase
MGQSGYLAVAALLGIVVLGAVALPKGRAGAGPDKAEERMDLAAKRVAERRVLVIAHRGDSASHPENTLPAFASAVKVGVDFVELDYYHSADGVPVVLHDKTLDRTTDAVTKWGQKKINIESKSAADLAKLDAGSWYDKKFAGTKLPTLAASLDTIHTGSMCLIERKGGDAATLIKLLRERRELGQVVVQAFDWKYLADCHKLEPKLPLGALGSKELTAEKLDEIVACGARVVGWKGEDLRKKDIEAIHARGLKAWAYTINEEAMARKLIGWGLDGLITDVPGRMKPVVDGR